MMKEGFMYFAGASFFIIWAAWLSAVYVLEYGCVYTGIAFVSGFLSSLDGDAGEIKEPSARFHFSSRGGNLRIWHKIVDAMHWRLMRLAHTHNHTTRNLAQVHVEDGIHCDWHTHVSIAYNGKASVLRGKRVMLFDPRANRIDPAVLFT
jgi:hypothetical protein